MDIVFCGLRKVPEPFNGNVAFYLEGKCIFGFWNNLTGFIPIQVNIHV